MGSNVGHPRDAGKDELVMAVAAATVSAKWAKGTGGPAGDEAQNLIAFDAAQITHPENRVNPQPGDPAMPLAATGQPHVAYALRADPGGSGQGHNTTFAYQCHGSNVGEAGTLRAGNGAVTGGVPFIAHALTAEGADASEDGTGRGTPLVPVGVGLHGETSWGGDVSATVTGSHGQPPGLVEATAVRRLTSTECEALQGFPRDWTATSWGKPQSDSARYRQLGNAVAVPVVEWVARRIVAADARIRTEAG
jgi:hypothetical protein